MAEIPQPRHTVAAMVYELHERRRASEQDRAYLGGSQIGHHCERYLWLAFRWCLRERFDGRMLRLFDTGHREEARLLEELREAGVRIEGEQFGVEALGGHFRGHLDAVALGLPEAPRTWHLVDCKTISAKKLKELTKKGLREFEPRYHAQAQVYMGLANLTRAIYLFVSKDDDTVHEERIEFDRAEFDRLMERARRIVFSPEPPARISEDAEFFRCRMCAMHGLCHEDTAPRSNCRTCAHSTPLEDGSWTCEHHGRAIDLEAQRAGCADHRVIPILLERWAELVDASPERVTYRHRKTGCTFANAAPPDGYTSAELHACGDKSVLGAGGFAQELREAFDGRIVA